MVEFSDIDDLELQQYCSATIANITTCKEMHEELVKRNGIAAVLEMCWSSAHQVKYNCVVALCRLSEEPKFAKKMHADSAVLELLSIMHVPKSKLQQLCLQTIVNMMINGCEFHDRVYIGTASRNKEGVIPTLGQLVVKPKMREFVAQVICAISNIPANASRAMHAGIAEVMLVLSRTFTIQDAKQALLVVDALSNFSALSDSLSYLATHGPKIIIHFVNSSNAKVLQRCAVILANFSTNADLRRSMLETKSLGDTVKKLFLIDCAQTKGNVLRLLANMTHDVEGALQIVKLNFVVYFSECATLEDEGCEHDVASAMVNLSRIPECVLALRSISPGKIIESRLQAKRSTTTFIDALSNLVFCEKLRAGFKSEILMSALLSRIHQEQVDIEKRIRQIGAICCMMQKIKEPSIAEKCLLAVAHTIDGFGDLSRKLLAGEETLINYCFQILFAIGEHCVKNKKFVAILCDPKVESIILKVLKTTQCQETQYCCMGLLYHICAATPVTNLDILGAAVDACTLSTEKDTLVSCSMTFSRVSQSNEGRKVLYRVKGLGGALNTLGRSGNPDSQYHASIASCNIAAVGNVWEPSELSDYVVVALLRTNSTKAQEVYAKALSNLLTHKEIRHQIVDSEALYALVKLASPDHDQGSLEDTLSMCIQALFNLSTEIRYHQSLFDLSYVQFAASVCHHCNRLRKESTLSLETRRVVAATLCQLSQNKENHERLISLQIGDLIRSACKVGDVETRISCVIILRNITSNGKAVDQLYNRKTILLLQLFLTSTHTRLQQFAIETLANFSNSLETVPMLHSLQLVESIAKLLSEVLSFQNPQRSAQQCAIAEAALKILCNMSLDVTIAAHMVETKLVLLLNEHCTAYTKKECELITQLLQGISIVKKSALDLVSQKIILLFSSIFDANTENIRISHFICNAFGNISTVPEVHVLLMQEGIMPLVAAIGKSTKLLQDVKIRSYISLILRNISTSIKRVLEPAVEITARRSPVASSTFDPIQENLDSDSEFDDEEELFAPICNVLPTIHKIVSIAATEADIMANLSSCILNFCPLDDIREKFSKSDGVALLIRISQCGSYQVQQTCAAALHKLVIRQEASIDVGLPELLMSMLTCTDSYICQVQSRSEAIQNIPEILKIPQELLMGASKLCRQLFRTPKWRQYSITSPLTYSPQLLPTPKLCIEQISIPMPSCTPNDVEKRHLRIIPSNMDKTDIYDQSYEDRGEGRLRKPRHSLSALRIGTEIINEEFNFDDTERNDEEKMLNAQPYFEKQMQNTRRACRQAKTKLPIMEEVYKYGFNSTVNNATLLNLPSPTSR